MTAARLPLAAVVVCVLAALVGCGTPTPPVSGSSSSAPVNSAPSSTTGAPQPQPEKTTPSAEPVTVQSNVEDGAEGVTVDTLVKLTAENGTLGEVMITTTVADRKTGKKEKVTVPGTFSKDHTSWQATDGLEPGATYAVAIQAEGTSGSATSLTRTFATHQLTLAQQTFPSIYPLGGTVGVGMPVIITFDVPVTDRKNVEKHLHVDVSPKQAGTWYWVNDSEVHYRPKNYWQAGTKITVDARLNGVKAGKNVYGQLTRTWSFTIGRKVVAKVDLAKHVMRVYVNDKLARTIKVSAGKAGFVTRSGVKVISEKLRTTPMRSETEDINDPEYYDLENVEYAMRLTNSGEFFHAAPWNGSYFGRTNSSHGCTGMSLADARWLYENMNIGDPAEFSGSKRGMETGNGYTDWNLSWTQVKSKSAL